MNTAVAVTGIIAARAVEITAILTGGRLFLAAIPQMRMQAPKDAPKTEAPPAPDASARPAEVTP